MEDASVVHYIKQLIDEEGALYSKAPLTDDEVQRVRQLEVELDQCWDFLRQRGPCVVPVWTRMVQRSARLAWLKGIYNESMSPPRE